MIETDCVIVGAGPCGLFQVFELGLQGLKAEVVDSIRQPGGQCSELYPDKPIYDIPAIPVCSGQELVENLLEQIKPFSPGMHLGEEVTLVEPRGDRFYVRTSAGTEFDASAIIVAGGVGSFQPRRIRAEGAEDFEGHSLHYRVKNPEQFHGKRLVVLGGGDSALDWTLALAKHAAALTLVHRRDEYRAVEASVDQMRQLVGAGTMHVIEQARVAKLHGTGTQIEAVELTVEGQEETVTVGCEQLLIFFGLAPKLGPIAEWGLGVERKNIPVDTEKFETCVPGIYAIGDINKYPGKKKLILSGFHEAALAAFAIKERLNPGKKVHLQYTTTSPLMHERLGVQEDPEA